MNRDAGAAVVAGASTGIGRATALALAKAGYQVFAGVRKDDPSAHRATHPAGKRSPRCESNT